MMRRPSMMIATIVAAGTLVSCGGASTLNGGAESAQRKKEKKSAGVDDQNASDPQVVTGAYLSCEISPADTMDAPASDRAVGCNVVASTGKPIKIGPSQSLDFSAKTPANITPKATNTPTGYQAVFHVLKPQLPATVYSAKLMQGSQLIKQFEGKVNDPLASLKLTENPAGRWEPLSGNVSFVNNLVADYAFDEKCPASPDSYCDADGNLSTKSPATTASVSACLKTPGVSTWLSALAGLFKDGPKPTPAPIQMGAAADICTYPKMSPSGSGSFFFNQGSKCSITVISEGGKPRTLVYQNSKLPFPAAVMEKRMQAMDCKTYTTR